MMLTIMKNLIGSIIVIALSLMLFSTSARSTQLYFEGDLFNWPMEKLMRVVV